jgi:transcriptional regulator with XRE-family HTH domain
MSQEALAAKLDITFQQLQKYERGANRISAGRLFELAAALDTTIPYFFDGVRETSRTMRGVAEEAASFAGPEDMQTEELVAAFRSIKDPEQRKSILALAKISAAPPPRPRPKTRRKNS